IAPDFVPMPYANRELLNRPIPAPYPVDNLTQDSLILAHNAFMKYPTDWVFQWVDDQNYYLREWVFASDQTLLDGYLRLRSRNDLDDLNLADDDVILIVNPTLIYPISRLESVLEDYLHTSYKVVSRSIYPDLPIVRYYIPIRYYNLPPEAFYIITQVGDKAMVIMGMA
ncbi:MAG TPA: hypothetical protein PLZ51_11960, partial [Aggregatilineales bacterium]|nr:hypothetical protein [Aggregatilineales bacterium]